ncbi:uncharacterized protein BDV14DRAFT_172733 [Aspergillus stella-maris]|uniref:uncharacterized protein n=1 Tax=Aspergillus stella-maris TaxID=1810926 RepID=UPI003CCCF976
MLVLFVSFIVCLGLLRVYPCSQAKRCPQAGQGHPRAVPCYAPSMEAARGALAHCDREKPEVGAHCGRYSMIES